MISQPGSSLRADALGLHDNFTSWAQEILCRRLSEQRGIVSSRVALLLRSAEIKPWLWDLCVMKMRTFVAPPSVTYTLFRGAADLTHTQNQDSLSLAR